MSIFCQNCGIKKKTEVGDLCRSCSYKEIGKQIKGMSLFERHKPDCQCAVCKGKRNKRDDITRDVLYDLYITQNKTMQEVGDKLNLSLSGVCTLIKEHNIPKKNRKTCYKVWNKGLDKTDPRVKASTNKMRRTRRKLYKNGTIQPWNKGLTKELDERVLKQANTNKKTHKDFKGKNNPFYGKKHTKKWSKEQSIRKGGTGIPYENDEYKGQFTYELKEKIRNRSNRLCSKCGRAEGKNKLDVHHIDYDKLNNSDDNLVALCKPCHRLDHNNKQKEKYGNGNINSNYSFITSNIG